MRSRAGKAQAVEVYTVLSTQSLVQVPLMLVHVKVCGSKRLRCHAGHQEISRQGSHFSGLTKFHDISRFLSKFPGIFSLFLKYVFQVVLNINVQTY